MLHGYDLTRLRETLERHEGKVLDDNGNHKPYRCSEDYLTIGIGWNLDANGLPDYVAEILLNKSIATAEKDLDALYPEWRGLSARRQEVLINMAFNLGRDRLSEFIKMWAAVRSGDFKTAAIEMLDSKWAGQVKGRATELSSWMEKG